MGRRFKSVHQLHFFVTVFDQIFLGEILKWPTRADCKSAGFAFRGSNPRLTTMAIKWKRLAGVAQLARASSFQAEGRGFEPRFPLHFGFLLGAVKLKFIQLLFRFQGLFVFFNSVQTLLLPSL